MATPEGLIARHEAGTYLRAARSTGGSGNGRCHSARSPETLGANHLGFHLKETMKDCLRELGLTVLDCGRRASDLVDCPGFAPAISELVTQREVWLGIPVDGAGLGSSLAASKAPVGARGGVVRSDGR